MQDPGKAAAPRALESRGAREVREQRWSFALETALQTIKKSRADLDGDRKSAPWKLAVAAWLQRRTAARTRWLASNLNFGTPAGFGPNLTCFQGLETPWSVALNPRSAT